MSEIDLLLKAYQSHVATPWRDGLSGLERIWFVVYSPANERRIRRRFEEFAIATRDAGFGWRQVDLADVLPRWLASQRHAANYYRRPEAISPDLYVDAAAAPIVDAVRAAGDRDVVAVAGAGSLFGQTQLSAVLGKVENAIKGRLLVFFPGTYEHQYHRYHLLGASEGWDYLAVPILAHEEAMP
jgi:hypothetical protein